MTTAAAAAAVQEDNLLDFFEDPPDETLRIVMQDGETTIAMHDSRETPRDEDASLALEMQSSDDSDVRVYRVLVQGEGEGAQSSRVDVRYQSNHHHQHPNGSVENGGRKSILRRQESKSSSGGDSAGKRSLGKVGKFASMCVEDDHHSNNNVNSNRLSVPINSDNSPMRFSSTIEELDDEEEESSKSCCFATSTKSNQLLRDHCKSKLPCVSYDLIEAPPQTRNWTSSFITLTLAFGSLFQPHSASAKDQSGKNAVHYCAENQNVKCIEQILTAEPALLNDKDEEGYTPLHLAVIAGNKAVIKFLVSKGADVNAVDNEQHSVIHWATGRNFCFTPFFPP